jgi:glycosyltransferase involved in cell wall biosynthesis
MPEIRRRESLALKKADWVFATTEWMRQRLIARGASAQRSSVLPIPTDSQKWRPANTPAPPTIVWAARLNDPRKNTLFLLKAFALLHPQYPAAQLKLIGQLFDDSLAEKAKQLGVDKQVIFTGLLSEKDRIAAFQSSQVFAVPSLQEGFCISAIEALSCELPVVSTRCGGPETFLDEEKGILVDTPEQMANAFLRLFQDQALRENMGRRGREMVQKHFSKSNFDQELRSVFSQVWGIDFTEASLLQPSIAKPSSG